MERKQLIQKARHGLLACLRVVLKIMVIMGLLYVIVQYSEYRAWQHYETMMSEQRGKTYAGNFGFTQPKHKDPSLSGQILATQDSPMA